MLVRRVNSFSAPNDGIMFKSIKTISYTTLILFALGAAQANAATQFPRVMWDANPAHEAVIGFSARGISLDQYILYGLSTDETNWSRVEPSQQIDFVTLLGYIRNYFVRLNGLPANSDVFFRICDQDGCGDRLYFRTAPAATDNKSPFVVVAGGDTRSGWTNRRKGNALIAKIRPLFVMHGGDFTNLNTSAEISGFLQDWELSFSSDTIDGQDYKRIYPLVPTHGNHEDGDYRTLCKVFGVDYNNDGNCSDMDTFGAFNVSSLLRVYTLNSQFKNSGYAAKAEAMNQWLYQDLAANYESVTWRIAQYHKPMFPHYSGKSTNTELFNWWAQAFYDYRMNLVVESDTHINKLTQAIVPAGEDFATSDAGTVYVGEGSWGAPARSANAPKSWTIDLASIQQFKVIQVTPEKMVMRTAQFDETAQALTREQRNADPLALPDGINWWVANPIGDTVNLIQNENGLSVIENFIVGDGQQISLAATDDTFISSKKADDNLNGASEGLLVDSYDADYGEMITLLKFDIDSLPSCIEPTAATLSLDVTNDSPATFHIYSASQSWQEGTATWDSVNGTAIKGDFLAEIRPGDTGEITVNLTNSGILDSWQSAGNFGLAIAGTGGCSGLLCNGFDMHSKETGNSPVLKVSYNQQQNCPTEGTVEAAPGALSNRAFNSNDGEKTVFRFTLASTLADAQLHGLTIDSEGELDETTDISLVRLYQDLNNDGIPEASEMVGLKNYTTINGEVTFEFAEPLTLTQGSNGFIVTYEF